MGSINIEGETSPSSALLHSDLRSVPPKVVFATGNYLVLQDGRRIFDATGGPAVACIGHGNSRVKDAVMRQMDQVSYCHSWFYSNSGAENLARLLVHSTGGAMAKAFVVNSGT